MASASAAGSGSNANAAPAVTQARPPGAVSRSRHVLSVLVQNRPGVLAQVSGMFASRGFNIDSLAVGETENQDLSRITVVVKGDERHLEQVRKQLEKMIPVVNVQDISREDYVERDLMLLKLRAKAGDRSEIQTLAQVFRARIVDVSPDHIMIEISGKERKIEAFIEAVRGYGILELARTGGIALVRGMGHLEEAREDAVPPANEEEEAAVQGHSEL